MKRLTGFFSALALTMPVMAGTTIAQTGADLSTESSQLSNGSPDWNELSLRIHRKRGPRDVKELTLTQTRRFEIGRAHV